MDILNQKIILASNNQGKIQEIQSLLSDHPLELVSQRAYQLESVAETGLTFVENALLKAQHASRITGLPAIADDSGLIVEKLAGAPGVRSARFAGDSATDQENIRAVIARMKQSEIAESPAAYICVMVYITHAEDPLPSICQGIWRGKVTTEPRGSGGFGYDPIFIESETQQYVAEMPQAIKNERSHRAQALQQLLRALS